MPERTWLPAKKSRKVRPATKKSAPKKAKSEKILDKLTVNELRLDCSEAQTSTEYIDAYYSHDTDRR